MNLLLSRSDHVRVDWVDDATLGALEQISRALGPADRAVELVIVDDARIREINRDFRGIDRATNVLAFSYLDDAWPRTAEDTAGEIYISHQTLEREATELGVDPRDLFLRIGVHGLLHVLGHDHETDADAARMEQREREALSGHVGEHTLETLF